MEKVKFNLARVSIELQSYLVKNGSNAIVPYRGNLKSYKFAIVRHLRFLSSCPIKECPLVHKITALHSHNLVLHKASNSLFYAPYGHSFQVLHEEVYLLPRSRFYALCVVICKAFIDCTRIVYPLPFGIGLFRIVGRIIVRHIFGHYAPQCSESKERMRFLKVQSTIRCFKFGNALPTNKVGKRIKYFFYSYHNAQR